MSQSASPDPHRALDAVRQWWAVITFLLAGISGIVGAIVGATWQVAGYDSRLSVLTSANTALNSTLASLSVRVSTLEMIHSQITERDIAQGKAIGDLQANAGHVNDRLDSLRDADSVQREAQAAVTAQVQFLLQHPAARR